MSIAEQIAMAIAQQTEAGDHNLSEAITYEYQDQAPVVGIRAVIKRGDARVVDVLQTDYEEFTALVLISESDLPYPPASGDRIRTATELWRVKGIHSQLPGAYLLGAARKTLRPEPQESA